MGVKTFFKKNGLPGLLRRLADGQKGYVKVGINSDDAKKAKEVKKDGVDSSSLSLKVIDIATFHEFGTENVPERSFIRSNDAKNKAKYKKMIQNGLVKMLKAEMEPYQVLGLVGEQASADIKAGITEGIKPALKQATIDRKGSSVPLIDTGQLRASITYKVGGTKKSSSESKLGNSVSKAGGKIAKKATRNIKKINKITKSSVRNVKKFAKTTSKSVKKSVKRIRKAIK